VQFTGKIRPNPMESKMALLKDVYVDAQCIKEKKSEYWIASSKNFFGLNIQADSYSELCEAVIENLQILIKENGIATSNSGVTVHICAKEEVKLAA
jgi:hypothetical protein